MEIEKRLQDLGVKLPGFSEPKAMYIPVKQTGNLLFVSGQIPFTEGAMVYKGKVGKDVTLQEAQEAAKLCALNILAAAKYYLKDLDRIADVVKLQVFVNSEPGFNSQHLVANGASQFLFEVFGENMLHFFGSVAGGKGRNINILVIGHCKKLLTCFCL